jgi:hypothetical protein
MCRFWLGYRCGKWNKYFFNEIIGLSNFLDVLTTWLRPYFLGFKLMVVFEVHRLIGQSEFCADKPQDCDVDFRDRGGWGYLKRKIVLSEVKHFCY